MEIAVDFQMERLNAVLLFCSISTYIIDDWIGIVNQKADVYRFQFSLKFVWNEKLELTKECANLWTIRIQTCGTLYIPRFCFIFAIL